MRVLAADLTKKWQNRGPFINCKDVVSLYFLHKGRILTTYQKESYLWKKRLMKNGAWKGFDTKQKRNNLYFLKKMHFFNFFPYFFLFFSIFFFAILIIWQKTYLLWLISLFDILKPLQSRILEPLRFFLDTRVVFLVDGRKGIMWQFCVFKVRRLVAPSVVCHLNE